MASIPPTNTRATLAQCQQKYAEMIADVSFSDVMKFVNQPANVINSSFPDSCNNYVAVLNFFIKYLPRGFQQDLSNNGLRLLLALDDGTVAIDSGRSQTGAGTTGNSFANYAAKGINENHNTRPEILQATLSSSGVGTSLRFSTTTNQLVQNYAVRLGNTTDGNRGTLRISFNTDPRCAF